MCHLKSPFIFFNSSNAVQGKYKLYPLPIANFAVGYYELTVEGFGEGEP